MLERCRVFLLIALGESVVTTGTAIAAVPFSPMVLITGASALIEIIALWALSFGRSHRLIMGHVGRTRDPIRSSRYAVNVMMVLVAGFIGVAVANAAVILRPTGQPSLYLSLLLTGGPLLFMAGQGWYLGSVLKVHPWLQGAGGIVILVAGLGALLVPPFMALLCTSASLGAIALVDQWRCAIDPPREK